MWALAIAAASHVPQYDCAHGCCHAVHHHGVSQVAYLKNAGGIEFDIDDLAIDGAGEIVDFDFVFKKAYDKSVYDVHVGCGGCANGAGLRAASGMRQSRDRVLDQHRLSVPH